MPLDITQMYRDVIYQSNWVLYSKIEILNRNFKIIDSIEGNLISDNFSIDADSDMRRSYNCTLAVTDSSYILQPNNIIWLDTYVRPYVGIEYQRTGEIVWIQMGVFICNSVSYDDSDSYTLSMDCGDLISTINGDRGGHFEGLATKVLADEEAYGVIVETLEEAKITKYVIEDVDFTIPYDLEFSANVTAYEILDEIRNLYPDYEMGFDVYGVFFFRKTPQRFEDNVVFAYQDLKPLLISESRSTGLTEIYNHIQVWGQSIDVDRYVDSSTLSGDTYNITLEGVTTLEDIDNFERIGFRINATNPANAKISINGLESLTIVKDDGTPLEAGKFPANNNCVFKYKRKEKTMYYLGQYQVFGEAWDENPDSPFNKTNLGRELLYVCEGDDYENIYSNDLAEQRARYEIYKHTVLSTSLDLEMIAVPWLDVNTKISYIIQKETEEKQYIIKSISGSTTDATMSISCVSFYPTYEYEI